jgi:hypothetical protein
MILISEKDEKRGLKKELILEKNPSGLALHIMGYSSIQQFY